MLNLFYGEPDEDRWLPFDRYPRRVVRRWVRGPSQPGGQKRVFLNLCAGLDRIGAEYRVNDYGYARRNPAQLACIVGKPYVLDRMEWKNPILFGPSGHSHPIDDPDLFERRPVRRVVVLGEWMREMCRPHWGDRVESWAVGIDTEAWRPMDPQHKEFDVLLYDKVRWDHAAFDSSLIEPIRAMLRNQGCSFMEIRYGFYREEEFRVALSRCRSMIFLCEHETQGIAYQQALACDVPILAWDRGGPWQDPAYYPARVVFEPVTSVPYWDETLRWTIFGFRRCRRGMEPVLGRCCDPSLRAACVCSRHPDAREMRARLSANCARPGSVLMTHASIRRVAQRIRHLPGLQNADLLWRLLRRPYQALLDLGGRGIEVRVGGVALVRMPAEFASGSWESHEPAAVASFYDWVRQHPGGLVLDVGSSVGIFSAVALFADSQAKVVAFDSDLSSLAAVRRLCQHEPGTRLRLVHGFLAEQATNRQSIEEAVAATEEALIRTGVEGRPGTTRYVCLTDADIAAIPTRRLDDLMGAEHFDRGSVLIKCDVEGAELLVLRGASEFLERVAPVLALSVHPPALPSYGHSKADVVEFLEERGYVIRLLSVDHEEHWWCEPRA